MPTKNEVYKSSVLTVIFCLITNYWTSLNLLHLIISVDLSLSWATFKSMWIEIWLFYFIFKGLHFLLYPPINFSNTFRICQNHYLLLFITDIVIYSKRIRSCSKKDWKLSLKPFSPCMYTIMYTFCLMVNVICEVDSWEQASRNTCESFFQ